MSHIVRQPEYSLFCDRVHVVKHVANHDIAQPTMYYTHFKRVPWQKKRRPLPLLARVDAMIVTFECTAKFGQLATGRHADRPGEVKVYFDGPDKDACVTSL